MNENTILSAAFYSKNVYNVLEQIGVNKYLSDIGKIIYDNIAAFYGTDPDAAECDKSILQVRLGKKYGKQSEILIKTLNALTKVSLPNVIEDAIQLKKERISEDLGSLLLNDPNSDKIAALIKELESAELSSQDADDEVYIGGSAEELLTPEKPENLVKLHPSVLNDVLGGGVPEGTHIVLFARPELGKSLLAINMAASFLHQGHKVVYFGNEDPARVMRHRFLARLSLMNKRDMLSNPGKAYAIAESNGFNNLVFVGKGSTNLTLISDVVAKHSPKAVIVDQMRNVMVKSMSRVEGLEYIARGLRTIYKDANAVGVSVTQAGDSATNKAILTMGDVDFSNTGIPATADVMLGIGADEGMLSVGTRAVTFIKNKISGDHSTVYVRVVPELSMAKNVANSRSND